MATKSSPLEHVLAGITDPTAEVALHRLVHGEVDRILAIMGSEDLAPGSTFTDEEMIRRVIAYEALMGDLGPISGVTGYWGRPAIDDLSVSVIERLAPRPGNGVGNWLGLWRYPAVLAAYGVGVAAVSRRRYPTVLAVLTRPVIVEHGRTERPPITLNPSSLLDIQVARRLPGLERRKTPFNDRIFEVLRPWLVLPVPDDGRYERAFDEFEYLLALVGLGDANGRWGPPGRFTWKGGDLDPGARLAEEAETHGDAADFLAAGLFGGSAERFAELRTQWMALQRTSAFW